MHNPQHLDTESRKALDSVGGELLNGFGFEDEEPTAGFTHSAQENED